MTNKIMSLFKGIAIGGVIVAIILCMFSDFNIIVLATLGIVVTICYAELRLIEEYFKDVCDRKEAYFQNKED